MDIDWRCWYALFILWEFAESGKIDNSNKRVLILPDELIGAEVGVHTGRHTFTLLSHVPWITKLYCIDRWEEYKDYSRDDKHNYPDTKLSMSEVYKKFRKNTDFFKKKIEVIKMDSIEATNRIENESLDFVFIDGNHEYEYVKKDIEAWYPKVKINGILSGHDYIHFKGEPKHRYEVKKAVDELLPNRNVKGTIWWIKKDKVNVRKGKDG